MKSPDLEVNVLVSMENVTERVHAALKNAKTPEAEFAARRAAIAGIERESQQNTGLRSDVVTLYQGGEYWLYRYKKYTDVRLVFAPEQQIAFFGGDPDNFTYPRYDLDMALFRVYENGKPIDSKDYLKWNPKGAGDGDLVFVSGHPGSTERLDTMAQLTYERDVVEPATLKLLKDRIRVLKEFSAQGAEQARKAASRIFSLENSRKAYEGRYQGLTDPAIMAKKQKEESDFKAKVMANPQWKAAYGNAWTEVAEAQKKAASRSKEEYFHGLDSSLASLAGTIVQFVAEIKKPDGERLPGFHDAQLDSLRFQLASTRPDLSRHGDCEDDGRARIGPGGSRAQRSVRQARAERQDSQGSGRRRTSTEASWTIQAVRKKLIDGGEAAVAASDDPMIVLARKLDPLRREFIKWTEQNVTSVEQKAGEQLGKARFAVYGKTMYPDATFTLRLTYGQVKGYPDERNQSSVQDDAVRALRPRQQFQFRWSVRPALALQRGPHQAGSCHTDEFRDHQRYYRRQLRLPGDQSKRRDRGVNLRRQYRVAGGGLRLRRGKEPSRRRPHRGDDRGANKTLRRAEASR